MDEGSEVGFAVGAVGLVGSVEVEGEYLGLVGVVVVAVVVAVEVFVEEGVNPVGFVGRVVVVVVVAVVVTLVEVPFRA